VPAHSFRSMEYALRAGEKTKEKYGVSSVEELRALPAEKIVAELGNHHHMTIDGFALTEMPWESYSKGVHNEEALLHGFNRDESAPFILFSQANLKNYEKKIKDAFEEPYASQVLALYPAKTDAEARQNWADIYTAVLFSYGHYCWERQAKANNIPSYIYYFTKDNGRLGAWHSGEEVYLYGNIPEDSKLYDSVDRELSRMMVGYYRNFIYNGDPNGEGLPQWQPDDGRNVVLEFGEEVTEHEAPYAELYRILDEMYAHE